MSELRRTIPDTFKKMRLSTTWPAYCILMLGATAALAHTYPHGEVTPLVLVRDGHFVIYTTEYGNGVMMGTTMFETVHAPDGSLITGKQATSLSFFDVANLSNQGADSPKSGKVAEELEFRTPVGAPSPDGFGPSSKGMEPYLRSRDKGTWTETQISLPEGFFLSKYLLQSEGVAVACARNFDFQKSLEAWDNQLAFVWLERPSLKIAFQAPLGPCAFIRPPHLIHSELIWADGRVWFSWIRKADGFEKLPPTKQWVTVLASYEPKSKKMEQKILPEQSHYNTPVSINTVNGWLCVAWHCSKDGSYPGESMIVTHFEKVSP